MYIVRRLYRKCLLGAVDTSEYLEQLSTPYNHQLEFESRNLGSKRLRLPQAGSHVHLVGLASDEGATLEQVEGQRC
jgi:hypothetical protein